MAQVDHRKSNEISAEEVAIFSVEPYLQSFEFINPGKSSFACETVFVDFGIEKAFAPSLCCFAIALVLITAGNDTVIEASFTGIFRVKCLVSVEKTALKFKRKLFH